MSIFKTIIDFFNHPVFIIFGGLAVVLSLIGVLYRITFWMFGITPVVIRLGIALWKRRVAIFANVEAFESLKASLVESKVFKASNIVHITSDNLDKAKDETVYLVDWETFGERIEQIFSTRKNHQTAIVIYAKPASIPQNQMGDIANRANVVVVNFRGRLLNDILTALITTSYDR